MRESRARRRNFKLQTPGGEGRKWVEPVARARLLRRNGKKRSVSVLRRGAICRVPNDRRQRPDWAGRERIHFRNPRGFLWSRSNVRAAQEFPALANRR